MATIKDYYETLGVPKDANDEDIKRAFRKLAFQCHPDHNKEPGAGEQFKRINEAYQVLGDPEKRAKYDRFGTADTSDMQGFGGFDVGGFGDIFEAFFGGAAGTGGRRPQRGGDLRVRISLSFEEAVFGCDKEVELQRVENCSVCRGTGSRPGTDPARCPTCGGSGQVRRAQQSIFGRFVQVVTCPQCRGERNIITNPCERCQGSGKERVKRKITIPVPAGVDDGYQLEMEGQGEAGEYGGSSGSLQITVAVRPHRFFKRDGSNILYELPINIAQAALGLEADIPTIEGKTTLLRIPPGVQSGRVLRLRGKGVHVPDDRGRGDQLVIVRVVTPQGLDSEQRRLLEELAKTLPAAKAPGDSGDDSDFLDRIKGIFAEK